MRRDIWQHEIRKAVAVWPVPAKKRGSGWPAPVAALTTRSAAKREVTAVAAVRYKS